jgi:hypothetical protein
VVARERYLWTAASVVVVLRILVACSKSSAPPVQEVEAGPPGEAFTACQIQGYVSESEAGLCPEGTCPALAFDTNGARVPCCTSIVSGPGMCVDSAGAPDGGEGLADGGDAADDTAEPVESGESGPDAAVDGGADGAAEAAPESGASDASPPPDAADGD